MCANIAHPPILSSPSVESVLAIIEALHDNVALVNNDGTMLWVSTCFERTYGVQRDDIVGRSTYELEQKRIFYPSVAALVLKTKRVVTVTEITQNGQYHIVSGVPIYDDEGNVLFVVSYSIDPRYSLQLHAEYERINNLLGEAPFTAPPASQGVVYASKAMKKLLETLAKLAKTDTHVLITGESGVGKNVFARILHQLSLRSEGPLVQVNCASIPDTLLESELFGYESGAFSGASPQGKAGRIELANKGTLFLDEIGELPLRLQAKFLQVIQEKQITKLGGTQAVNIDFRLVTATNQDLRALVEKKRFRSDLFFRLNVLPIDILPLRERSEDILPLCHYFLSEMNEKYKTTKTIAPELSAFFLQYHWLGNIRELRNVMEQLVVISEKNILTCDDLPNYMRTALQAMPPAGVTLPAALEEVERTLIRKAYALHKTTVAVGQALGISQATAARKIARYCRE